MSRISIHWEQTNPQSVPTYRGEGVSPGCCHTGDIPEASFPCLEAPGCTAGLQARQPAPLIPPRPLLTSRLHLKVKLPSPAPSVLMWLCPWKEASSLWLQDPPMLVPPLLRSVLHPLSPHSPLSANRVPDTLRAGEQSPTQEGPSGPPPEAGVRVLYPVNGRVTLGTWEQKPGTCLCAQTRAINSNLQISSAKWW